MTRAHFSLLAAVLIVSGCSTAPKVSGIQKVAVGGGFVAVGSVTVVAGAAAGIAVAVVSSTANTNTVATRPSAGQTDALPQTLLLAAGIPVLLGAGELLGGFYLLTSGGEEIQTIEDTERRRRASVRADLGQELTKERTRRKRPRAEKPVPPPAPPAIPEPEDAEDEEDEGQDESEEARRGSGPK
jgi:hypothetical protein